MMTVTSEEALLDRIISTDPAFNNKFNNYVRRMKEPYYGKITLVKSGGSFFTYPCDPRCPLPSGPRVCVMKRMDEKDYSSPEIETSDGLEDERCFRSCTLPLDVKYIEKKIILNEYKKKRNNNLKSIDLKQHPENILVYAVISKEILDKDIIEKAKKRPTIPQDLLFLLELSDRQPLLLPGLGSQ